MTHLAGAFRLGRDAEKHSGDSGDFLSMSLAYDVYSKGESKTQWVRGTMGGSRVEKAAEHLVKGAQIEAIIKDAHIVEFKDKDGNPRAALEGRILDFTFIGSKKPAAD